MTDQSNSKDLDKLEDALTLWGGANPGEGDIAHRACLAVSFYFADAHTVDKREAVLKIFEDYQQQVGDKFHWTTNPDTGKWKNLSKSAYMQPRDWLLDNPDDPWEFVYHNGERRSDAANIRFHVLATAKWEQEQGDASYLSLHYPLTWFANHPNGLTEQALKWAEWLQPLSGHGSIALTDAHRGETHELWETVVKLARRFPGLDIADPLRHSLHTQESVKGPDWLVILADKWVKKLGGEAAIQAALPEPFSLHPYAGGLLIRAGQAPQLGDATLGLYPEHYRDLAALLKPIQINDVQRGSHSETSHAEVMGQAVVKFDRKRYLNWLNRFDRGADAY